MTCREWTQRLRRFAEGDLPWTQRLSMVWHRRRCAHCRAFWAQWHQTAGVLAGLDDPTSEPPELEALTEQFRRWQTGLPPLRQARPPHSRLRSHVRPGLRISLIFTPPIVVIHHGACLVAGHFEPMCALQSGLTGLATFGLGIYVSIMWNGRSRPSSF